MKSNWMGLIAASLLAAASVRPAGAAQPASYWRELRCLEAFAGTPGPLPPPPRDSRLLRAYRVPTVGDGKLFLLIQPHAVRTVTSYYFVSLTSARYFTYAQKPFIVEGGAELGIGDLGYEQFPYVLDLESAGGNFLADGDWHVRADHRYFRVAAATVSRAPAGRRLPVYHDVAAPLHADFSDESWGGFSVHGQLERQDAGDPAARAGLRAFILRAVSDARRERPSAAGIEDACAPLMNP